MRDERTPYDEKLDAILAAAAETFAAKGYHNASIRDIARATGVSLSGFYYYLQSKDELLYLIQDHAFTTLLGKLEERLCGVTDPRQRLHILMDNQLTYFVHNMADMKVLSHQADSLGGEFLFRLNSRMRRLTFRAEPSRSTTTWLPPLARTSRIALTRTIAERSTRTNV